MRDHLELNQREFSSRINISQPTLTLMENGQRTVRDIHVSQICSEFNVSEEWLRTGEGEMFVQEKTFSLDENAKKFNLSEFETDIMLGYMELPLSTRKDLLEWFGKTYAKHAEAVATAIDPIEVELERYRQELEAEKKGQILSASGEQKNSI